MCQHCSNPNLRPAMMDHRRWAFYNLGAQMCGSSGLGLHGPACETCATFSARCVCLPYR